MKMNKKGFTLIELLAVIVILAVIALIAVPRIIELLNSARKSAAEDTCYGIIEAGESYMAEYMLKNQGNWNGDVTFTCSNEDGKGVCKTSDLEPVTLEFKGKKPIGGTVTVSSTGTTIKDLKVDEFTCNPDTKDADVIVCNK